MAEMVNLFSYGSLRQEGVQRATFGRVLEGAPDALPGYALSTIAVVDEHVIETSGSAQHRIAAATGDPADRVPGLVLRLTEAELAAADAYEPEGYVRVAVRLVSGAEAFAYVKV
jgi:hypothetical protein